mmetsp:Transcript_8402/g.33171  ORF Transcript_8402/g.33171 Transcript_8402/m.33171 type:complete len:282 (+) Transcript_8402:656-1501(+)
MHRPHVVVEEALGGEGRVALGAEERRGDGVLPAVVGALVVPELLLGHEHALAHVAGVNVCVAVHGADVPVPVRCPREELDADGARVVPLALVHGPDVGLDMALLREELAAVGTGVPLEALVHGAPVEPQPRLGLVHPVAQGALEAALGLDCGRGGAPERAVDARVGELGALAGGLRLAALGAGARVGVACHGGHGRGRTRGSGVDLGHARHARVVWEREAALVAAVASEAAHVSRKADAEVHVQGRGCRVHGLRVVSGVGAVGHGHSACEGRSELLEHQRG